MIKKILSLKTRKKIKSKVFSISKYFNETKIFVKTNTSLSNNKKDIINFSIISWHYRYQRPQHLAKCLSKLNCRVFYIQTELLPSTAKKAIFRLKEILKNIYLVNLSSSKELFIYTDTPNNKDIEIFRNSLNNLIVQANIKNPILKIDHPFWYYFLKDLDYPIIYDCMDNHKDFPYYNPKLDDIEETLIKKSNHVIASSNYLKKIINTINKKNTLIPNAVDYNYFSTKQNKIPKDIENSNKPIIGYYGAISPWIDDILIEKILIEFPKATLLLIGQVDNLKIQGLQKKYPNLILLGEKSYQDIPKYLEYFNVCLIPFKITPLIKATNPVKIYEYLSKNKAVVTTKLPELEKIKDLIYLSNSHHDFIKNINTALKENKNTKRQKYAKLNTWEKRCKQLNKIIELIYSNNE